MEPHNTLHTKIAGFFKLQVGKMVDGKEIRRDVAEFPNLITNQGLDRIATLFDYTSYCQVGTGNTTPTVTDTGLVARIAGIAAYADPYYSTNSISPYESQVTKTYIFGEGVATGNLSEVGIGWSATTASLFSRALILDSNGSPTTITILSTETLYVYYTLKYYPKLTDSTGSVTFTGNIGGTYNWTMRVSRINSISYNRIYNPSTLQMARMSDTIYHNIAANAFTGSMGSITSYPSGTAYPMSISPGSYTPGSYTLNYTISASLTQANVNILSLNFAFGICCAQIEFGSAIPKTSYDVLSITINQTWGRV